VSEDQIKLPTDGFNAPSDLERVLLNKQASSAGTEERPMPTVAPDAPRGPDFGAVSEAPAPVSKKQAGKNAKATKTASAAGDGSAPGFSFE
jgi:pilus assembly protein CpaC